MSYTPEVWMDEYSTITSLKINTEHQNHQIEKENHLPNLHLIWFQPLMLISGVHRVLKVRLTDLTPLKPAFFS